MASYVLGVTLSQLGYSLVIDLANLKLSMISHDEVLFVYNVFWKFLPITLAAFLYKLGDRMFQYISEFIMQL